MVRMVRASAAVGQFWWLGGWGGWAVRVVRVVGVVGMVGVRAAVGAARQVREEF